LLLITCEEIDCDAFVAHWASQTREQGWPAVLDRTNQLVKFNNQAFVTKVEADGVVKHAQVSAGIDPSTATTEQRAHLEFVFKQLDANNDGVITIDEFKRLARDMDDEALLELFNNIDLDAQYDGDWKLSSDGNLTLQEWLAYWECHICDEGNWETTQKTTNQLIHKFSEVNDNQAPAFVKAENMFTEIDTNSDGMVSQDEMESWLNKNPTQSLSLFKTLSTGPEVGPGLAGMSSEEHEKMFGVKPGESWEPMNKDLFAAKYAEWFQSMVASFQSSNP